MGLLLEMLTNKHLILQWLLIAYSTQGYIGGPQKDTHNMKEKWQYSEMWTDLKVDRAWCCWRYNSQDQTKQSWGGIPDPVMSQLVTLSKLMGFPDCLFSYVKIQIWYGGTDKNTKFTEWSCKVHIIWTYLDVCFSQNRC